MISVEIRKILRGNPKTGFDSRGVIVEYIADGEHRHRRFKATHLIDSLHAAGLKAAEVSPTKGDRSRLFVTRPWGDNVDERDVYNVFRNTDGVDVSPISLA